MHYQLGAVMPTATVRLEIVIAHANISIRRRRAALRRSSLRNPANRRSPSGQTLPRLWIIEKSQRLTGTCKLSSSLVSVVEAAMLRPPGLMKWSIRLTLMHILRSLSMSPTSLLSMQSTMMMSRSKLGRTRSTSTMSPFKSCHNQCQQKKTC